MAIQKEYQIFCHFCAIGEKRIRASNFEEAKQIAESEYSVQIDKILRLTEPCRVDDSLSHRVDESFNKDPNNVEYKNWGSE
jgi:hypothetical protein